MLFSGISKKFYCTPRSLFFLVVSLFFSLFALAQVNLKYRLLNGYSLIDQAPVNKNKSTFFVFEQAETLEQAFKPTTAKRSEMANFGKEMVVGVVIPPTNKPPKLSVSRVFVQDSTLTVRYIRMADTSQTKPAQLVMSQPTLLIAVPKQTVLKTRFVENGKLVQTIQKHETE